MTKPAPKNLPASVRQKLANLARERNVDFGLILVKYGLERILFRLSRSRYRDVFILKGALLFELWTEQRYRPTRDADFLARGDNAPERFAHIFQELCVLDVDDDGLRFDPDTVEAERISEDADYEGVRVTLVAYLERAKIPIQIDIGFGDIITPAPSETDYPALLEFPGPRLMAYPKETVVAEKLEALVKLGIANTRMKDFYDLEILSRTFAFEGKSLAKAIQNTFQKRGTDLPIAGLPVAFTSEFYDDVNKKRQWTAFCAKNKSYVENVELKAVLFLILSIACAGLFCGAALYVNFVEHPARMSCGQELALRQFAPSYQRATIMQVSLAIGGLALGLTAAWRLHDSWVAVGAVLLGASVPFTLIVIFPTNKQLLDPTLDSRSSRVTSLFRRWNRLHAIRSLLSATAFGVLLFRAAVR